MTKICVIVPVYNAEAYLKRCIESILNQTYRALEIVLVDDGSQDNSGVICDEYGEKYSCVHVLHQKNRGQSAARNRGLDYMYANIDCEYVGFVDSDDWIHPQMYDILYNILIKHKANMSICSYQNVSISEEDRTDCFGHDALESVISESKIYNQEEALQGLFVAPNDMFGLIMPKLYRKDLFVETRFEEGVIYEDVKSCFKVLYEAERVAVTFRKLYYYYYNPQSTTKSAYTEKRLDIIDAMEEQLDFFKEKELSTVYTLAVRKYLYLLTYHGKLAHDALGSIETDRRIRKRLRELFWKERKNCNITPANSPDCYNTLFPNIMKVYWTIYAVKEKLKHDP